MAGEEAPTTFLSHWIFSQFLLPFLLVFFVVFAILEKTRLLGEKKNVNAAVAFVVGLIFAGALYPKMVVSNLVLFFTVAVVAIFVILLIWGFVFGEVGGDKPKIDRALKIGLAVVAGILFIGAVLWATGWYTQAKEFLSDKGWGQTVWTNAVFLIVIAIALALILINPANGKGKG